MELKLTSEERKIDIPVQRAVYETLCYFDIFRYPLQKEEILNFCRCKITIHQLDDVLHELLENSKIRQCGKYYLLHNTLTDMVDTRIENEERLKRKMPVIKRFAKLVSKFPFVKGVFISGSISKGVLKANGDVDYFIIAAPNRLWLCRTCLILFKKIFLLNSKKYFCVNYFVSSDNMKIPDDNLFVATEIKTLIPVFENGFTLQFKKQNEWTNAYLPNFTKVPESWFGYKTNTSPVSRLIEKMCASSLGENLDNYFFWKTLQRWQKKFPHFKLAEFDLNMRSYKNVSKHHPLGHQLKVLDALALRLKNF